MIEDAVQGQYAVELHGHGQVGRALLELLPEQGIGVAGVWGREGLRVPGSSRARRVFVDATSPCYEGPEGERWLSRLEEVLAGGTPVVTCNKAPLAIGWERISNAARRGGTTLSCSATVGGGTPILLAARRLQRSQGVVRVDASLNGTLNYICDRVVEGATLSGALSEAVAAGISEPDPTLDLDGTDCIAKGIILHNLLFPRERVLTIEASRPRLSLREADIRSIGASKGPARAVATITPGGVTLALAPFPEAASGGAGRAPAAARVTLRNGLRSSLVGPGAGAAVTAGALLGDLLDLTDSIGSREGRIAP